MEISLKTYFCMFATGLKRRKPYGIILGNCQPNPPLSQHLSEK